MAAAAPAAKALRAGFVIELDARGGSMWPLLRTGDRITVEPTTTASLRRGDVAVVRDDERGLVAHRVVSVDPLILRGDRLDANDLPYATGALVGRVRALRRGPIAIDLDSWIGRALSHVCAAARRR